MQERINKVIKQAVIILIAGLIYLIWCRITKMHIPCLFKMRTGLYCPGCGITDVFVELSKFNFAGAFNSNPVVVILMPIWAVLIFDIVRSYILDGEFKINKLEKIVLWLSVCCLMIFCAIRNISNYIHIFSNGINLIRFLTTIPRLIFNTLFGIFRLHF